MLEGFEIIAKHGLRIALHAETASIMAWREKRLQAAGRNDPLAHLASRPAVVAVEAVSRAAVLAEWTGARIHILHISSADELRPYFRAVTLATRVCNRYGVGNDEEGAPILVCTGQRVPWSRIWSRFEHYS